MLFSLQGIPSTSSVFSAYASVSASVVLFRTIFHQVLPYKAQDLILQKISIYLNPSSSSSTVTLLVEETSEMTRNEIYDAAEVYLLTKIRPNSNQLRVSRSPKEKNIATKFAQCENIVDSFDGIEIKWRFNTRESKEDLESDTGEELISKKQWFDLSFDKEYRDKVLDSYLPFVLDRAETIRNEKKSVRLHALAHCSSYGPTKWNSIDFQHPSTFDTLAMDPGQKRAIVEDLDRFMKRKEYYQRVGKAWKRGYLLYGPPGTGKSSLISAIANYLGFDVYDLQLTDLKCDSDFRGVLLTTTCRSVIVVEDIDCGVDLSRKNFEPVLGGKADQQLTLSGLLNFLDGLWSSCGDGRIIIFTTNHKDKLDPALLRPGRMDVHIHMSYCTFDAFKVLASNLLGVSGRHHCSPVIQEIEDLIQNTKVTPAEVAEELMKSDNAGVCLTGLVNFLKRKKVESSSGEILGEESKEMSDQKAKRQRIGG